MSDQKIKIPIPIPKFEGAPCMCFIDFGATVTENIRRLYEAHRAGHPRQKYVAYLPSSESPYLVITEKLFHVEKGFKEP